MERYATFRFREADLPLLLILLGEFGWMVPPGTRHPALLRRLRETCAMMEVVGPNQRDRGVRHRE